MKYGVFAKESSSSDKLLNGGYIAETRHMLTRYDNYNTAWLASCI